MNSDFGETVLRAEGVRKKFRSPDGGFLEVLRGASLSVGRGESVSLRGESGAGKTTFLNILAGLESPSGGEVFWDGARIDNLPNSKQAKLRAGFMGFVFQNYCLVPELNALENVCLAARIAGRFDSQTPKLALGLLERVGLKSRAKHLPSQMSGGEKQRVAVARAILNSPQIILADEPTGALDTKTSAEVMALFKSLNEQGRTVIIVTHDPKVAEKCDRIIEISDGMIVSA